MDQSTKASLKLYAVSLLAFSTLASSPVFAREFRPQSSHTLGKRAPPNLNPNTISTNNVTQLTGKSYDYVIVRRMLTLHVIYLTNVDFVFKVGGGTAGLAIAARLAEDVTTTIAVIEGGGTGDEVIERILAREFVGGCEALAQI